MRVVWLFVACSIVCLTCLGCSSAPSEEVLSFQADLSVQPDSSILVDETIRVTVAGEAIKRGIYREVLNTHHGQDCVIRVIGAWRDGEFVPFKTEERGQRTRIRIVRDEGLLSHGTHSFRVKYEIQRRLEVRGTSRTLEWNVTGIRWNLPILAASARVRLPEAIDVSGVRCSSKLRSVAKEVPGKYDRETNEFCFTTENAIEPGDGFVIKLKWVAD